MPPKKSTRKRPTKEKKVKAVKKAKRKKTNSSMLLWTHSLFASTFVCNVTTFHFSANSNRSIRVRAGNGFYSSKVTQFNVKGPNANGSKHWGCAGYKKRPKSYRNNVAKARQVLANKRKAAMHVNTICFPFCFLCDRTPCKHTHN